MSKLETIGSILPMQNTTYSWFTLTYHSRSDWRLREKKRKASYIVNVSKNVKRNWHVELKILQSLYNDAF